MSGSGMYEGCANHQTDTLQSLLSTLSTYSTYSTELLDSLGILDVVEDEGFGFSASSRRCPGRMDATCCPRGPITSPAPVGPISTFGTCLGHPRHRTADPLVEGWRPGTSTLGPRQQPFRAPGASAQPGAGHSGDTSRRVAQRHHRYRSNRTQAETDPVTGRGGGDQKTPELVIGASPAGALRHPSSTDRLVSDH